MERKEFDLKHYLAGSAERIANGVVRAALSDPKEIAFMARFALSAGEASKRRAKAAEKAGRIPPFLIASITGKCGLSCAGYHSHADGAPVNQLTGKEWERIFAEARALGISSILLAGGEPLLRRDVIEAAGNYPEILFPIFTNGTLLNDGYVKLFDKKRNLVPVLSIEGRREETDGRQGGGVCASVRAAMKHIQKNQLIFGASVTVTTANLREVTAKAFLDELRCGGCKSVIYVEYVPVTGRGRELDEK